MLRAYFWDLGSGIIPGEAQRAIWSDGDRIRVGVYKAIALSAALSLGPQSLCCMKRNVSLKVADGATWRLEKMCQSSDWRCSDASFCMAGPAGNIHSCQLDTGLGTLGGVDQSWFPKLILQG